MAFESAAADDPSIENLTLLAEVEEAALYRGEWVQDVETVAYAFTQAGAALLDATGRPVATPTAVRRTGGLYTLSNPHRGGRPERRPPSPLQPDAAEAGATPGLTELQQETLVAALERVTTSFCGRSRWGS